MTLAPIKPASPKFEIYTAREFIGEEFALPTYLDGPGGYFYHPGRVILWGPQSALKTWWALSRLIGVAARGVTVVACLAEGNRARLQRRLTALAAAQGFDFARLGFDFGAHFYVVCSRMALTSQVGVSFLEQVVVPREPGVVLFDPLASYFGRDENKVDDVQPFLERLNTLVDRNISVCLVHHANKGYMGNVRKIRGSTAWEGWADVVMQFDTEGAKDRCTHLVNEKNRDDDRREDSYIRLEVDEEYRTARLVNIEADEAHDKPSPTKRDEGLKARAFGALTSAGAAGLTQTTLKGLLRCGNDKLMQILTSLFADGVARPIPGPKGAKLWQLVQPSAAQAPPLSGTPIELP